MPGGRVDCFWFVEKERSRVSEEFGEPAEWEALSAADSARLSEAALALPGGAVSVGDNRLFQVDLGSMRLSPLYWSDEPRSVRRSAWFRTRPRSRGNAYWPVDGRLAEELELAWSAREKAFGPEGGESHVLLEQGAAGILLLRSVADGAWVCTGEAAAGVRERGLACAARGTKVYLQPRSMEQAVREASEGLRADPSLLGEPRYCHLIFVVHGIGQKFVGAREFRRNVDTLRGLMEQALPDTAALQVIPLQWRKNLRLLQDDPEVAGDEEFDRRIASITLPSIPAFRAAMRDTGMDVLLYMSPRHQATIGAFLCQEMNRVYARFRSLHPGFGGGVSVVGHSLGAVIAFEVLSRRPGSPPEHRLDFAVDHLFALGSPLAMVLVIRGVRVVGTRRHGAQPAQAGRRVFVDCNDFYNIFHPTDPVAYRMEPLLAGAGSTVSAPLRVRRLLRPSQMPAEEAGAGADAGQAGPPGVVRRLSDALCAIFASSSRPAAPAETPRAAPDSSSGTDSDSGGRPFALFNRVGRVDLCLGERLVEYSYLSFFGVHSCYWRNRETAEFIAAQVGRAAE